MVATPLRLADALLFNGYTITQTDVVSSTVTLPTGTMILPALRLSSLVWQRPGTPSSSQAFYLDVLPTFTPEYRPYLLSAILDRYSTRRIGYDTLDTFGLAVRRWSNLHLGAQSVLNRRYLSAAVPLPLTTQDATTTGVDSGTRGATTTGSVKNRVASSDFPQGQLSGNVDYANDATDSVGSTVDTVAATATANTLVTLAGRVGVSVMELLEQQRAAYVNVDMEILDEMDSLFMGVWDRSEVDAASLYGGYSANSGYDPGSW